MDMLQEYLAKLGTYQDYVPVAIAGVIVVVLVWKILSKAR